jgi:hypothetical protein
MRYGHASVGTCVFCVVLFAATLFRIWLSTLGWNYDIESWRLVAGLVDEGKNWYVYTHRLPYGPVWGCLSWFLLRVSRVIGGPEMETFHVLVATFLSIIDACIAVTLARSFGTIAGLLFILSPISMLITGYHSQIDNLAIVLALWSWLLLRPAENYDPQNPRVVLSAGLLGLSLVTKHVFLLFPVWFLFVRSSPPRARVQYLLISYGVFLLSFTPFVLTSEGLSGVWSHVFQYRGVGFYGNALVPRLLQHGYRYAFFTGLLASGVIVARLNPRQIFFVYPLALLTFTPTMADQYLTIPVVTQSVWYRNAWLWLYSALATAALIASPRNVGGLNTLQPIAEPLRRLRLTLTTDQYSTLLPQLAIALLLVTLLHTLVTAAWIKGCGDTGA